MSYRDKSQALLLGKLTLLENENIVLQSRLSALHTAHSALSVDFCHVVEARDKARADCYQRVLRVLALNATIASLKQELAKTNVSPDDSLPDWAYDLDHDAHTIEAWDI